VPTPTPLSLPACYFKLLIRLYYHQKQLAVPQITYFPCLIAFALNIV
jgi:hypothetical protein